VSTKKAKPANGTKSSVTTEPPLVRELAIVKSNMPAEFASLADIQRVSFTNKYLDSITIEQETELCKSGLRISHTILGPLLIHLKERRRILKLRDWESFCRNTLGYTKQHCDRLIAQAKRIQHLMVTESGRKQLEAAKEEKRVKSEERKADRKAQKRAVDAKAKMDAEELKRRRNNERALEQKPTPEIATAIMQDVIPPKPQKVAPTNEFMHLKAPQTDRDIFFFNMGYKEANIKRRGSYEPDELPMVERANSF